MFPITITIHDQAQFDAVRTALVSPGKESAPAPKPAAAPVAAPGPATAPAQADAAPEKTASAPAPAAESAAPAASPSTAATEEKVTLPRRSDGLPLVGRRMAEERLNQAGDYQAPAGFNWSK